MLSAKHGLLEPGRRRRARTTCSSATLDGLPRAPGASGSSRSWASGCQLAGATVEVHGGVDFAQPLRQPLARRGAALEIPLPGTWQDAGPGEQRPLRPLGTDGTPVRAALHRLRALVSGHRSPDADRGAGSPPGRAHGLLKLPGGRQSLPSGGAEPDFRACYRRRRSGATARGPRGTKRMRNDQQRDCGCPTVIGGRRGPVDAPRTTRAGSDFSEYDNRLAQAYPP